MLSNEELLNYKKQYARLIVEVGLNLTANSYVNIICDSLSEPDFVELLAKECYDHKARYVKVNFKCPEIEALSLKHMSNEELARIYDYKKAWLDFEVKEHVMTIYLESLDPDWLKGVDPNKFLIEDAARRKAAKPYRNLTRNQRTYVICSIPSYKWAKSLFPKVKDKDVINTMWETIFKCCHLDKVDSVKAWHEYCKNVDKKAKWLNSLNIKELHYKASNGTDFKIGILPHTHFMATYDYDARRKKYFYSNIPTEECFTSPDKYSAEGTLVASKPLNADGVMIKDFYLKFKKGKVVEAHAKVNEKALKKILATDEGSCYLGECALVPFSSPINQTGLIFKSILYDENAACHFALGDCYTYTHDNGINMSEQELKDFGFNFSNTHIDFMVGTKDLSIVAITRSNKKVVIFKNGEWAK